MLQLPNVSKEGTTSTPVSKENDVSTQVIPLHPPPCYCVLCLNIPFQQATVWPRGSHLFHWLLLEQAMTEDVGTPSHTTTAMIHRKRTDVAPRSLSRDLIAVTTQIQTITKWKDEVERHMSQNKDDMAAVNKKLDLLLEVFIPTAGGGDASNRGAHVATNTMTCSHQRHNVSNISVVKTICNPTAQPENERTCSASGVSEEMCPGYLERSLPGTRNIPVWYCPTPFHSNVRMDIYTPNMIAPRVD